MRKLWTTINWVVGLLVAIALINWGTVFWFNLNIVEVITFNVRWLSGAVYTLVSVIGTLWALGMLGITTWWKRLWR